MRPTYAIAVVVGLAVVLLGTFLSANPPKPADKRDAPPLIELPGLPLEPADRSKSAEAPIALPGSQTTAANPAESVGTSIQLKFAEGKQAGEQRILIRRNGFDVDATRIKFGTAQHSTGVTATAAPAGIQLETTGVSTVCKEAIVRPLSIGIDLSRFPSNATSGQLDVIMAGRPGFAIAMFTGAQIEFSRLVLSGEKNSLEIAVGDGSLQVKTKNSQVKCSNLTVHFEPGCRLRLSASYGGPGAPEERISIRHE